MAETPNQKTSLNKAPSAGRIKPKKKNFSSAIFNIIMEYRDSRVYQWVNRHPEVSIAIVGFWGMLIIIMFLYFVISKMVG